MVDGPNLNKNLKEETSLKSLQLKKTTTGLTFYDDRNLFNAVCPDIPIEDFEGANIALGNLATFYGPLNSATNNAYFSTGSVLDGFSLSVTEGDIYLENTYGSTTKNVSSNYHVADMNIDFSPSVDAVGVDLNIWFNIVGNWIVEVYGASGLLGSVSAPGGSFLGVTSDSEPIIRVLLDRPYYGAVIDNLAFGNCEVKESEPNNEYGDSGIIVIEGNNTFKGEVKKPGDFSDLWYINAGASGPLTIKNNSSAKVWMDVISFSNNYGGPGNMLKHIVRLKPGNSKQVILRSDRYYVVNVYVPFRSSGGAYEFEIAGTWN